jgi:hypothetical protein
MSDDNYILSSTEIDDNHLVMYDRPTIRVDRKKKLYKKYYNSKWANLKLFLQEQKSLETSVKLQKQKTIEQFSSIEQSLVPRQSSDRQFLYSPTTTLAKRITFSPNL